MLDLFGGTRYDFIGKLRWVYVASLAITLVTLVSREVSGLRYDLELSGGLLVPVHFIVRALTVAWTRYVEERHPVLRRRVVDAR